PGASPQATATSEFISLRKCNILSQLWIHRHAPGGVLQLAIKKQEHLFAGFVGCRVRSLTPFDTRSPGCAHISGASTPMRQRYANGLWVCVTRTRPAASAHSAISSSPHRLRALKHARKNVTAGDSL